MRFRSPVVAVALLAAALPGAPSVATARSPLPRLTIAALDDGAPTASFAEFEVRFENLGGEGRRSITFGDNGPGYHWTEHDTGCFYRPGDTYAFVARHPYRYPGRYTVTVRFEPDDCNGVAVEPYEATTTVTIVPGPRVSNGPESPRLDGVGLGGGRRPGGGTPFQAIPRDEDGYLRRLTWSWGDGTRDFVVDFPLRDCRDPKDHWPSTASQIGTADEPAPWLFPGHRYARRGTYVVRVTAVTTGCDGRHAQTVTTAVRVTV